jgi:hypothetical protein
MAVRRICHGIDNTGLAAYRSSCLDRVSRVWSRIVEFMEVTIQVLFGDSRSATMGESVIERL